MEKTKSFVRDRIIVQFLNPGDLQGKRKQKQKKHQAQILNLIVTPIASLLNNSEEKLKHQTIYIFVRLIF